MCVRVCVRVCVRACVSVWCLRERDGGVCYELASLQRRMVESSEQVASRVGSLGCQLTQFTSAECACSSKDIHTKLIKMHGSLKKLQVSSAILIGVCFIAPPKGNV